MHSLRIEPISRSAYAFCQGALLLLEWLLAISSQSEIDRAAVVDPELLTGDPLGGAMPRRTK
jgi:hypothetical protein